MNNIVVKPKNNIISRYYKCIRLINAPFNEKLIY
jgi:hypothetical protein